MALAPLNMFPQHHLGQATETSNQIVLYNSNTQLVPYNPRQARHTQTMKWKSRGQKQEDLYKKIRRHVRHVAPSLVSNHPNPVGDQYKIFPQNRQDFSNLQSAMWAMRADELEDNARKLRALIEAMEKLPATQRKIKPAFEKEGKELKDVFGTVLCQPTVWTPAYCDRDANLRADWPEHAELIWNGDTAEKHKGKSGYGRCFPPLHEVGQPGNSFLTKKLLFPTPMDQTGGPFQNHPDVIEVSQANWEMEWDENFEEEGAALVGEGLMKEVGLPNWKMPIYQYQGYAFEE
jgi:hypothetical protein